MLHNGDSVSVVLNIPPPNLHKIYDVVRFVILAQFESDQLGTSRLEYSK